MSIPPPIPPSRLTTPFQNMSSRFIILEDFLYDPQTLNQVHLL